MRRCGLFIATILLLSLTVNPVKAKDDPAFLALSMGLFDIVKNDDTAAEFRFEYLSEFRILWFKPFLGTTINVDGGKFIYAGVYSDFYFGRRIVVSPSIAPAYYNKGGSKDLGYDLQFRSQLDIAYRLDDRSRIGLSFNHFSNAGLGDTNKGSESLAITYSLPLNFGE